MYCNMKSRKTMRKYGRNTRKRNYKGGEGEEDDICSICQIGFTPLGTESAQSASSLSLITAREAGVLNVQRCNQQDETYTHPHCKSKFHMKCIKQWCANKDVCTCPICRGTDIELPLNEYDLLYKKYMTLENKCKEIDDDYTYLDNEYTKLEDECNEAKEELVTALEAAHKHYKKLSTDYNKLIDTTNITQKKYDALQIKYGELVRKK